MINFTNNETIIAIVTKACQAFDGFQGSNGRLSAESAVAASFVRQAANHIDLLIIEAVKEGNPKLVDELMAQLWALPSIANPGNGAGLEEVSGFHLESGRGNSASQNWIWTALKWRGKVVARWTASCTTHGFLGHVWEPTTETYTNFKEVWLPRLK